MRGGHRFRFLLAIGFLWSSLAAADVSRSGAIVGTVKSDDGTILPGATVTLTGSMLIQNELTQIADPRGMFRFSNVNPGTYVVLITMEGFARKEFEAIVHVGRTVTVDAVLPVARAAAEVVVRAEAPLVDKTTPTLQTNYTAKQLEQIPSSRRYIDVVDTAAGLDNRMAFGAGGNVDGYDVFGFGAATNQYQINGVSTSNMQFGNTWVNPSYDTIQEVQIVGPGASAEYSEFTGATINVITKTGTNAFHGGATVYGTSSKLMSDNSGGILDLAQPTTKSAIEANAFLGGPIVPEKFLFFASGQYNTASRAPILTDFFDEDTRQGYQLRLDYLANSSNTVSAMFDYEPIKLIDQGFQAGTGPEVSYFREQHTNTGFLSWLSTWSSKTFSEVKYAGVEGYLGRIPTSPNTPSVYDYSTGLYYNSTGFQRLQRNWRHEGRANATHYLDEFLGGSHELKGGVEYEWSRTRQQFTLAGNANFYLVPLGNGATYVQALTGYNYHQSDSLRRPGVFIQDKATWKRVTVSAGLRYDNPKTVDDNTGNTLLKFDEFSPRIGATYDVFGNGKTIVSGSYGRYFDKVPTYGPGTYAGTGFEPVTYYGAVITQPIDPRNWQFLVDTVLIPENITTTFDTQSIPVTDGIKAPRSDIVSARIEQSFSPRAAVSVTYLHRHTKNYVTLVQFANNVTYEPFTYTSDFTGQTFTSYTVTGGGPRQFALGNMDFWFQRGDEVILEFRSRPTDKSFLNASFAYEHTVGTRDNNECGVLSLCTNGVDTDPNVELNPFYQGELTQSRPFNFKILGTYDFPFGITASADFRWFSGRHYGAQIYNFQIGDDRFNDPFYGAILLEPKDARRTPNSILLNLRAQKDFNLGAITASLIVDVLNVTNEAIDFNTNVQNNIVGFYSRESARRGEQVSNFGKPYSLNQPRQTRLGVRVVF